VDAEGVQKVANVGAGGAMGSGLAQVRAATGRAVSLCNRGDQTAGVRVMRLLRARSSSPPPSTVVERTVRIARELTLSRPRRTRPGPSSASSTRT